MTPAKADREHTFLFADLAGFTAMTEAHGDERAVDVLDEFVTMVRSLVAGCDAELVKTIGDAVLVRCDDAGQAVRLGLAIVEGAAARHGHPIVRVGMHTGPAIERDGDWYGATVNLAARISGAARGDEVLLSEATRAATGEVGAVEMHLHATCMLKNIGTPVRVFCAHRAGRHHASRTLVDPVCHMALAPDAGIGTLVHAGRTYHFCSLDCAGKFAADPDRYAGAEEG